jgi:hypothetical protein
VTGTEGIPVFGLHSGMKQRTDKTSQRQVAIGCLLESGNIPANGGSKPIN